MDALNRGEGLDSFSRGEWMDALRKVRVVGLMH